MSQSSQTAESFIPVSPSVDPAAPKVRQLLVFEFQPATGTYVQVDTEVVAVADPLTGMVVRTATVDAQDESAHLLRAILSALTVIANELSGHASAYSADDFIRPDEET